MAEGTTALDPFRHSPPIHRVKLLSWLTLSWLTVDGAIGMTAGITANSVTLIGWGLDCAIQAIAALVIIWRFSGTRIHSGDAERLARKIVAASYFLLEPYIIVEAIDHLASGTPSAASWLGIALAASDAVLMPVIGHAKRHLGFQLGSYATCSDGRQNILCAYLSVAVLLGLAANAVWGLWWSDPLISLVIAVVVVLTGVKTWKGYGSPETC